MGAAVVSTLALAMTATLVGAVLTDTPLSDDGWLGWPAGSSGTILDDTASSGEPAKRELSSAPSRTPPAPSRSASRREPGPRTSAAPSRTRQMSRSASPATPSARQSRTSEPPATGRETEAAMEPELGPIRDIVPPREPEATATPEPELTGQASPAPVVIVSGAPA